MSTDVVRDDQLAEAQAPAIEFELTYNAASRLVSAPESAELALFSNTQRDPVKLEGKIKQPLRFREALSALYAVVASDFRYKPKDRTAYLAYKQMKRESAGMTLWQAQQAYFSWLIRNDPLAFVVLDPIITVHPDRVLFEVFSKDE